jgi:hypothetical protein
MAFHTEITSIRVTTQVHNYKSAENNFITFPAFALHLCPFRFALDRTPRLREYLEHSMFYRGAASGTCLCTRYIRANAISVIAITT